MTTAPVVVVGAGPVGLTVALSLAKQGLPAVVVEAREGISDEGSKALVIQRRTLELLDWAAPGVGTTIRQAGVTWNIKRTYYRDRLMFSEHYADSVTDSLPPFVNLPQTETDRLLLDAAERLYPDLIGFRFGFSVVGVTQSNRTAAITSSTGEVLDAPYIVGCDGAHSVVRQQLGVQLHGKSSTSLFLITDIRAQLPFPRERRFYYDPSSNRGRQILIMPQPANMWRIDWQVDSEVNLEEERNSGRLDERIQAVIGDVPYEIVWSSLYRFHNLVAESFRDGRVFLAGDAAHLMSPFGARGMNSGVADAQAIAVCLRNVLVGGEPPSALDQYAIERRIVAQQNVAATSKALRIMEPPTALHRQVRNILLRAGQYWPSIRRFVDSGPYAKDHPSTDT